MQTILVLAHSTCFQKRHQYTVLHLMRDDTPTLHPQDKRIRGIVESGDLEQLAEIVLNGDGGRLMGLTSPEPEIQAFLNNVPTYMVSYSTGRKGYFLPKEEGL